MRVALIATSVFTVPPRAYGGIELFVGELAEQLVSGGHDVTVFATADSRVPGTLRACFDTGSWPPSARRERLHARHAWGCISRGEFDVVHVNTPEALAASFEVEVPLVVTLHHPRNERLVRACLDAPRAAPVAISARQAESYADLSIAGVIHHGLDPADFPEGNGRGGYCAFLGRIGPEKAPHLAIDAARAAGVPLVLAGPRWSGNPHYDAYFEREVRPRLALEGVTWIDEVGRVAKRDVLAGAIALLVPLGRDEPFGLAMVEAMLCGTPVIAFDRGAAPEIVDPGVTGYVVNDALEMARHVERAASLDRGRCRARAAERFNRRRMTDAYVELYASLVSKG
jgi:glycosyltransferase involved in cell wall biosynthesis